MLMVTENSKSYNIQKWLKKLLSVLRNLRWKKLTIKEKAEHSESSLGYKNREGVTTSTTESKRFKE